MNAIAATLPCSKCGHPWLEHDNPSGLCHAKGKLFECKCRSFS